MIGFYFFFGAQFQAIFQGAKLLLVVKECNFSRCDWFLFFIDSEYLIRDQPLKSETGKLWSSRDF